MIKTSGAELTPLRIRLSTVRPDVVIPASAPLAADTTFPVYVLAVTVPLAMMPFVAAIVAFKALSLASSTQALPMPPDRVLRLSIAISG